MFPAVGSPLPVFLLVLFLLLPFSSLSFSLSLSLCLPGVVIYERYDFYSNKVELINLAWHVLISRCTAQLISLNMALALLFKCHLFLTFLYSSSLKMFLPLEFANDLHLPTGNEIYPLESCVC